jgi:hypothetical protein
MAAGAYHLLASGLGGAHSRRATSSIKSGEGLASPNSSRYRPGVTLGAVDQQFAGLGVLDAVQDL